MFRNLLLVLMVFIFSGCINSNTNDVSIHFDKKKTIYSNTISLAKSTKVNKAQVSENMFSKSCLINPNMYEQEFLENIKGKYYSVNDFNSSLLDLNNDIYFTKYEAPHNLELYQQKKPIKYQVPSSLPIINNDSFKYFIKYHDEFGNKKKSSFSEFKDNLAKPSFPQEQNMKYSVEKNKPEIVGFSIEYEL